MSGYNARQSRKRNEGTIRDRSFRNGLYFGIIGTALFVATTFMIGLSTNSIRFYNPKEIVGISQWLGDFNGDNRTDGLIGIFTRDPAESQAFLRESTFEGGKLNYQTRILDPTSKEYQRFMEGDRIFRREFPFNVQKYGDGITY